MIEQHPIPEIGTPLWSPGKNRTSATMACRRRRLLLGLFLIFCLISCLLVLSSIRDNPCKHLPKILHWGTADVETIKTPPSLPPTILVGAQGTEDEINVPLALSAFRDMGS